MSNLSLYDIESQLLTLEKALEDEGGDVSDGSNGEKLLVAMEPFLVAEKTKIDAFGRVYLNLKAKADVIKAEEERLSKRRRAVENNIKRLKALAQTSMERRQIVKLEGDLTTIAIQKNGGKPSVKLKVSVDSLPKIYRRVIEEPDLEKMREALLQGDVEVGAYIELEETGYSIRFR